MNRKAVTDKVKPDQQAATVVKKPAFPTPPNGGLMRDGTSSQQEAKDIPAVEPSPIATPTQVATPAQVATPSGNFIKSDQSLVMQSGRAKLYSEKYRDGIVNRILAEKTTIGEVRESLGLSEYDVVQWIKQSMDRKTEHIAELKAQVAALKKNLPQHLADSKEENRDLPTTLQFPPRKSQDVDGRSRLGPKSESYVSPPEAASNE